MNAQFYDIPDSVRIDVLRAIQQYGASKAQYIRGGIRLAMPRLPELQSLTIDVCESFCLTLRNSHYFPLGSDNAPKYQRHDASYKGSRGFWLYSDFMVKQS